MGGFGSHFHDGNDIRASIGTPAFAALGGTVIAAGWRSGYGNYVEIETDDGRTSCFYGHLNEINCRAGQRVTSGEYIGKTGATGNVKGAHLHFGIHHDGQKVDPQQYLNGSASPMVQTAGNFFTNGMPHDKLASNAPLSLEQLSNAAYFLNQLRGAYASASASPLPLASGPSITLKNARLSTDDAGSSRFNIHTAAGRTMINSANPSEFVQDPSGVSFTFSGGRGTYRLKIDPKTGSVISHASLTGFNADKNPGIALSTEQAHALGVKPGGMVRVEANGRVAYATYFDCAGHRPSGHFEGNPNLLRALGYQVQANGYTQKYANGPITITAVSHSAGVQHTDPMTARPFSHPFPHTASAGTYHRSV